MWCKRCISFRRSILDRYTVFPMLAHVSVSFFMRPIPFLRVHRMWHKQCTLFRRSILLLAVLSKFVAQTNTLSFVHVATNLAHAQRSSRHNVKQSALVDVDCRSSCPLSGVEDQVPEVLNPFIWEEEASFNSQVHSQSNT